MIPTGPLLTFYIKNQAPFQPFLENLALFLHFLQLFVQVSIAVGKRKHMRKLPLFLPFLEKCLNLPQICTSSYMFNRPFFELFSADISAAVFGNTA
jgi:hypothetical protein